MMYTNSIVVPSDGYRYHGYVNKTMEVKYYKEYLVSPITGQKQFMSDRVISREEGKDFEARRI